MVVALWERDAARRGQRRRRHRWLGRHHARPQRLVSGGRRLRDRGGPCRGRDDPARARCDVLGWLLRRSSSIRTGTRGRSPTTRTGRSQTTARSRWASERRLLRRRRSPASSGSARAGHSRSSIRPRSCRIARAAARGGAPGRQPAAADVVIAFTTARETLTRHVGELAPAIFPDRTLWVAWPKRASKVPTDITEDVVRDVALPLGLVDVKVAAIDETWSGLKLVWRREHRAG